MEEKNINIIKSDDADQSVVGKIQELRQEANTWKWIADELTQQHQQSVRRQILKKVDDIISQIEKLSPK